MFDYAILTQKGGKMSKENAQIEPDINAYIEIMEEIKRRVAIVLDLHSGKLNVRYEATQVESMVLQVRKIIELIVLASLSVNKSIFEQNRKKFENHWHPKRIIRDIESLNPDFCPTNPIDEQTPKDDTVGSSPIFS